MAEKKNNSKITDKEKVEYCTEKWKGSIIDDGTSEKIKRYLRSLVTDARNFSLSFLPEKTQRHILNMNKEALRILKSIIEKGENLLGEPKK